MALDIVAELDISPWDGLLMSVRRAAGRVAWVDARLALVAERSGPGGPDDGATDELHNWLEESRRERVILARASQMAIAAGVAERFVRQTELESAVIVRVLARTLDALGLDPDQRVEAHAVVHRELLAIGGPEDLHEL